MLQLYNFLTINYAWKNKNIILYTNQFNLVLDYHLNKNYYRTLVQHLSKNENKIMSFKVLDSFIIRDMKYFYGSDKLSTKASINAINSKKIKRWNSSYTGEIGEALKIEAIKKEFPRLPDNLLNNMLMHTSQGAIIYASEKEAKDVHSYDVISAYPSILLGKVPYSFKKIMQYNPNKVCFGKITIKNFKAKYKNFIPLYKGKENPKECVVCGKRIYAGLNYTYYGFIKDELRILNTYYNYESLKISDLYECEMDYLPRESRTSIINLFNRKNNAKGTEDYEGYKQMFNRLFGYFITTCKDNKELKIRDKRVPYQVGLWIISQQRQIMLDAIDKVSIDKVVSCHTDGIKVIGNHDIDFKELNNKRGTIYKNIGHWSKEEHIDRIQYLSNVKAKYEVNGKLYMKHGGISDEDIEEFLANKTYDSITLDSKIKVTLKEKIAETKKGTFITKQRALIPIKILNER